MRLSRRFFTAAFFVFAFIFLSSAKTSAQGAVSYTFLDVVDFSQKPVANAAVKVDASCGGSGALLTDKNGRVKNFPIGYGDCNTYDFTISKAGYYTIRDIALFRFQYFNDLFKERFRNYRGSTPEPFKFELLVVPKNKAERRAVGKEQSKRELFWAIADKDAAKVEKLLQTGVDPNVTTDDLRGFPGRQSIPAFIFAASFGDIEAVKSFLRAGVNLRAENSPVRDVLLYYLDANPRSSWNDTPPETDADKKRLADFHSGVDVLIEAGASVKATTKKGKTALMIAAAHGDARTVKTLLDKKLPVNQTDSAGTPALIYATHFNYAQNPNKLEVVKILLDSGASVNLLAPDVYGGCTSPLMNAAGNGNLVLVKLLLDSKADAGLSCADGQNALRAAVKFESYASSLERGEIIKTLIDAGADVNFADASGQTNLMFAVGTGSAATVQTLLKNGALINARDKDGATALMRASFYQTEIAEVLLKHGADPNVVAGNLVGVTDGRIGGSDCATALMRAAVTSGAAQSLELLARHGANVDFACANGETALVKAARNSQVENVKKLLELGADAKGESGRKALNEAREMLRQYEWSREKSGQIIKLLEAAGAK